MYIPLVYEHLFSKYCVCWSGYKRQKSFATYGCCHPCFLLIKNKIVTILLVISIIFVLLIIFRSDKEKQESLDFNDDLEEESEAEENINYETDSDEERKSAKKFTKVLDDGDKEIYIERYVTTTVFSSEATL